MRHILGFILCLIGTSLCFSCGERRSAHPYLMKVGSLMQERPDSALALLQVMSDVSSLTDADKAYYAVLLTAATDKNYLPLLPCDSLLDFALRFYDGEKEEARALFYKGRLLAEMNDLKAAIDLNLKALDILENYPEETDIKMLIYGWLGIWYSDSELYEKAREALRNQLLYSRLAKDSSVAYQHLATCYMMKDDKDSAIYYEKKSLETAEKSADSALILLSMHNMSVEYKSFDEIDSALYYSHKLLRHVSPSYKSYPRYCYHLGNLYRIKGNKDSARFYLNKSEAMPELDHLRFYTLSDMEAEDGNYEAAYHFLDSCVAIEDSIRDEAGIWEVQHLVYKHQTEVELLKEQMKSNQMLGMILLGSVSLFCFIIVFYRWKMGEKEKREALYQQSLLYAEERLKNMQASIDENERTIAILKDETHSHSDEIARKEKQIEELKKEKFHLRVWLFKQSSIYKKVHTLSEQVTSNKKERKVMSEAEHEKLRETVLGIFSDYVDPLRDVHPRLTDDDLLLLCLQEMNLPPLVIAMCYGYSDTSTINQRKSRLKNKMS